MPRVKLTQAISGHREADIINVTDKSAEFLTANGYAERDKAATPAAEPKTRRPGRPRKTTPKPEVGGDSPTEAGTTAG